MHNGCGMGRCVRVCGRGGCTRREGVNVGEGMKDMEGCMQGRVCVIEGVVWVMSEGEGVSLEDPTRQIHTCTYCTRTQTLHAPHPSHFDAAPAPPLHVRGTCTEWRHGCSLANGLETDHVSH